jgi:hypothetical protein
MQYVEEIEPKIKPVYVALQKKFLEAMKQTGMTDAPLPYLAKRWDAEVAIFRGSAPICGFPLNISKP